MDEEPIVHQLAPISCRLLHWTTLLKLTEFDRASDSCLTGEKELMMRIAGWELAAPAEVLESTADELSCVRLCQSNKVL